MKTWAAAVVAVAAAAPWKPAPGLAYVALGCFWTSEFAYECDPALPGVRRLPDTNCPTGAGSVSDRVCVPHSTVVGYMGGHGEFPTYSNYTTNNNFTETVRIEFNPRITNYSSLLDAFWSYVPNPTEPCPDPAYCPRIFYVDDTQKQLAELSLAKAAKAVVGAAAVLMAHLAFRPEPLYAHLEISSAPATLLVEVLPAADYVFWKAEEYHQNYDKKQGLTCNQQGTRSGLLAPRR